MAKSKLLNISTDLAIDIINLSRKLQQEKEFIISNQIGRSGTSIGANIREAQYAQSRADFISKFKIALKEANETVYWLEILLKTDCIDNDVYRELNSKCSTLRFLLISSIKTASK